MAVQAHYPPSNVLLLNTTTRNEGGDYSLQTQPGAFMDQPHMFFNNGVGGSSNASRRKRTRQPLVGGSSGGGGGVVENIPMTLFSLQPHLEQPTTFVNVSELFNQPQPQPQQEEAPPPPPQPEPSNMVSTGLHLALEQRQHYNNQQQQQGLMNQQHPSSSSSVPSLRLNDLMNQQNNEIDQLILLQGDQLRRTLAEKRQEYYSTLIRAAEKSATRRLQEKQTELEAATRHYAELETRAAQVSAEAHVWQARARSHEAYVAELHAQLEQAQQALVEQRNRRREAGEEEPGYAEDAESGCVDRAVRRVEEVLAVVEEVDRRRAICKVCDRKVACVVIFPCRHLSLCMDCESFVGVCPQCFQFRTASVPIEFP